LILGGHGGPRALRLAARWADEYNLTLEGRPDRCREVRDRLSRECERAGRDPGAVRLSLMTFAMVGSDRKELEGRAARLLERRGERGDPGAYLDGLPPDRLRGTPRQLLDRLAELGQAGVERIMMQHLLHDDLEALALIGREVIPEAGAL
jgi:alkanesulfonate monooxygenase SsuD/methylene tetrahydromethanopterin reductase-like flavin-dependent oxidoreductase (luciferase family)